MYNFSLKNSLLKLNEKNYEPLSKQTIKMLIENYDEDQLRILSGYQGLKLDNNIIRLFFVENVGFRCFNEKDYIFGNLPICRNIESFMNNLYLESIHSYMA